MSKGIQIFKENNKLSEWPWQVEECYNSGLSVASNRLPSAERSGCSPIRRREQKRALPLSASSKQLGKNGLDPYEYLKSVFTKAPNLREDESVDILLPWNAPDDCRSKSASSTELIFLK